MSREVTKIVKTISSLEIVEEINKYREAGSAVLQHKHFLAKVLKVLGEDSSAEFSAQYKGKDGASTKCYNLPKREAALMVMSESYKVQAAVYDRMTALEDEVNTPANGRKVEMAAIASTAEAAIALAKMFGFTGNHALLSADRATNMFIGISPLKLLGAELIAESKDRILTPTELGKLIGISAQKINVALCDAGLQAKSSDGLSVYDLTEKGKPFAELLDVGKKHSDGTPVKQIKWYARVLELISTNSSIAA